MDFTKKIIDKTKWGINTNKIIPAMMMRNHIANTAKMRMPKNAIMN